MAQRSYLVSCLGISWSFSGKHSYDDSFSIGGNFLCPRRMFNGNFKISPETVFFIFNQFTLFKGKQGSRHLLQKQFALRQRAFDQVHLF